MEKKNKIILATVVGLTTIGFGAGVGGLVHYANNKDLGIETRYFSKVESFIRTDATIYTDTYLAYCTDPSSSRYSISKFFNYNPETQSFTPKSNYNVNVNDLDIHYVEDKTQPLYDKYTGVFKGYAKMDCHHITSGKDFRFGRDFRASFYNSTKTYIGRGILTTHTQLVRGWTTNYYTLTLEYYKTSSDSLYAVQQWSFDGYQFDRDSSFMTFRSDDMSINIVAVLSGDSH